MPRSLLVLALVTGCGTQVATTPINTSPRPLHPRSPDSVEVFVTAAPPRPYVDVAYLEAEQESELAADNTGEFIAKLRVRAAELGCDGVILGAQTNRETVSVSDVVEDAVDVTSTQPVEKSATYGQPVNLRGLTATCIVYRPEPGELEAEATQRQAADARIAAAHEACRQQRIEIMRRAAQLKSANERGRMYRSMPTCEPTPAAS